MDKGVIFDFDGVIIDSFAVQKKALFESYQMIVGEENPPSFEEFLSYSGDSLENIFNQMNLPLGMIEPYKRISREHIDAIEIFDGIIEVLTSLQESGYKIGLCTGKNRVRTLEILEYLHIRKCFDVVICSDDVSRPKPASDSLELAIKFLGITKENAIMVGDAPNDIKCAKALAVKVIGVTWGKIKKEILLAENPDCIVGDVSRFIEAIQEL